MSELSAELDPENVAAVLQPVKCYSLEKQLISKPLKKHCLISGRKRIINRLLEITLTIIRKINKIIYK